MTMRNLALQALAPKAAAARARHVRGAAGFVDEDELFRIQPLLISPPGFPRGGHVGTILLAGEHAFF